MDKKGKIIPNGVILKEHEYATVLFLTERGFDVELLPASTIQGTKNADICLQGIVWEMKAPIGKGRWVIKNIMQKAAHQSENLIMDLRRLKQYPQQKYINEVEQRFFLMKRFKRLKIIAKGNILLDFQK